MSIITATWNTSADRSQALQILRNVRVSGLGSLMEQAREDATMSYAFVALPDQTSNAVSAIMNILLDAQGNAQLSIIAKNGYAGARTGEGDDTISMDVRGVYGVSAGSGDDIIGIQTSAGNVANDNGWQNIAVSQVHGEDGDDTISITSEGDIHYTSGGAGDDKISLSKATAAVFTYGDEGDDKLYIQAREVFIADGGAGNDALKVQGTAVARVLGGDGDDSIRVTATTDGVVQGQAIGISGGNGNDTIDVTADVIGVAGDKGDDTLTLNNTGTYAAEIYVVAGDGHDSVTTNGAVSIIRNDGSNRHDDLSNVAIVDRIDDTTVQISYADTDDTITLHLTGDMASKPLAIDFHLGGKMVIRDASSPDNALPSCLAAVQPVVQTRSV